MTELTQASRQWASRPADERFTSLLELRDHFEEVRSQSRSTVVPSKRIHFEPTGYDHKGLQVVGPNGHPYAPTHWSFGQLAQLAEAPAGYLRTLPAPIAADNLNYGLQFKRDIEDVGVLLQKNGENVLRAATGPRYGRIWNIDVVNSLIDRFGDGVNGEWKVPGEFGKDVPITKANTTLFASDRDTFIFLADEKNRIEVPNRRDGKPGELARGFFVWNSEVGSTTLGIATFLFDFVCANRIVWGAEEFNEIRIRHTASAPDKWLAEITPALQDYAESSSKSLTDSIQAAQSRKLKDDLDGFLKDRFGKQYVTPFKAVHEKEEGRPIESLWDVTTAATAYARSISNQDRRVKLEREAGKVLDLAA